MGETRGRTAAGVLIAAAALLAGCGGTGGASAGDPSGGATVDASGGTPADQGGTSPTPETRPTSPANGRGVCQAATMKGRIRIQGAGMGSTYAVLIVTNTGKRPCDATGYVGMRLLDAQDRPLPTNVRREGRQLRNLVILAPGDSAYTEIRWSTVPAAGDNESGPCQPKAETLEVTAPDDTRQFPVDWNGSSVCSRGTIDTTPLRTGTPPEKRSG
ncbi:MAG: DUF4232 domain-containing protein [Streptosporangiales bacterium]|nr:DUF4232 domain-containing protein [Streptosporangiales bacterium]